LLAALRAQSVRARERAAALHESRTSRTHYVNVCEAPPGDADLEEAVAELVPRVTHTHARVGHEEGPQVPDVADPRWAACARNDADRVKASLPVVPPLPPPATPLDGAPQRYAAARSST
jgi:hypothetical protein